MQKMIHEILSDVKKTEDKNIKVQILKNNFSPALKEVLKYVYSPYLKFFTNQVPNYRGDNAPEGMNFNSLFNECRRFYVIAEESIEKQISGKVTNPKRKNEILIQILENVHPKEAEVLSHAISGDFSKYYGITKKLIEENFPEIMKR